MKEIIRSKQNGKIKEWRKLLTSKGRQQQAAYLVEGLHLVEEALTYQQPITDLILTESFDLVEASLTLPDNIFIHWISDDLAKELSGTVKPQGIFAVIDLSNQIFDPDWSQGKWLLLDRIQDPGNLGTMIRTADAAGFNGVVLGKGTVDLYNDKVLRSTQGSLWHLPIVQAELNSLIKTFRQAGVPVLATALHQSAQDYRRLNLEHESLALLMGNEAQGLATDLIAAADQKIYIPMKGKAESLNVGVAAAVLMFYFS
ncbi:TrmH family RNA methyltransferase [Vaginisenegalia massiliensis]|uniref:TrmH family RNA methyltransferase n=1 Tax=Vaginisenegalia massiliensis TaxID=2058294 RepID=UPI000F51EA4B|nr:RNA methyltransferase [Vaginisenegalia massiliensis]